jgi:pimeloyl-ACP methyl ester carboxylesterase
MSSTPLSTDLLYCTERGSGPPLLLIHGLMITCAMFEVVVPDFAERHRVIVPDLRGSGRSRGLPPPYTASQLAADLSHLLDHLGIDSTAVLGYSQGGAVAQQFVLDYPKRCSRLVLACTYAYNMMSRREKLEGHLVPLLIRAIGMKGLAKLVVWQGLKQFGKERAESMAALIADQDAKLMLAAWKEAMLFDSRDRLGEVKCPTLIIAGTNDTAVPFHHAKMLHDGIPGSRLVTVQGADHALLWSRPDEFARIAEEFLSS